MTQESFINALEEIGIQLTENKLAQLEKYYLLLIEWNEKINLTAITEKDDVYLKHFYDSLTMTKIIDINKEECLCDVGTGAGFPGIVLKIVFPHLKLTLVDALNKRLEFLKLVCAELNLTDVEFVHARAEDYSKEVREKYDIVTARAVAKLNVLLEYCAPLVKKSKYFIAMKGKNSEIELCEKAFKILNLKLEDVNKFSLPFENGERCLVKIKKNVETSMKYPRKFSEIKKKPL